MAQRVMRQQPGFTAYPYATSNGGTYHAYNPLTGQFAPLDQTSFSYGNQAPQKKSRSFLKTLLIGGAIAGAGLLGLRLIRPTAFNGLIGKIEQFTPDFLSKPFKQGGFINNAFQKTGFIGKGLETIKKPFQSGGALESVGKFFEKITKPLQNLFNKTAK